MEDIYLKCKDCGREYVVTAGEQEFYNSRVNNDGTAFSIPKRCVPCRAKKKARYGNK